MEGPGFRVLGFGLIVWDLGCSGSVGCAEATVQALTLPSRALKAVEGLAAIWAIPACGNSCRERYQELRSKLSLLTGQYLDVQGSGNPIVGISKPSKFFSRLS